MKIIDELEPYVMLCNKLNIIYEDVWNYIWISWSINKDEWQPGTKIRVKVHNLHENRTADASCVIGYVCESSVRDAISDMLDLAIKDLNLEEIKYILGLEENEREAYLELKEMI